MNYFFISHMSIYIHNVLFRRIFFIIFAGIYLFFLAIIIIFCIFLKVILLVLFIDGFHLIIALSGAWSEIWLLSILANFILETDWLHTVMTRSTKWPGLLLDLWWTIINTISVRSKKLTFTLSTSKPLLTFSRLILTNCFHSSILSRGNFIWRIFSTYWMQEIRIFTVSITITLYHVLILLLSVIFLLPVFHAVGTSCILQLF